MRRPIRKPFQDDPNDTKKGHFQSRNEATHTTILWPPLLHSLFVQFIPWFGPKKVGFLYHFKI
jgi:hypothetical protein